MTARLVRGYATATLGAPKRKYRNVPTMRGDRRFPSKAEANRYDQLKLLEKNGEVRNLKLQVSYPLKVNGKLVCRYRADFVYEERIHKGDGSVIWREVVEDKKGFMTPAYRIKKNLMQACHGIDVRET